jgi:hypothetical protein
MPYKILKRRSAAKISKTNLKLRKCIDRSRSELIVADADCDFNELSQRIPCKLHRWYSKPETLACRICISKYCVITVVIRGLIGASIPWFRQDFKRPKLTSSWFHVLQSAKANVSTIFQEAAGPAGSPSYVQFAQVGDRVFHPIVLNDFKPFWKV